MPFVKILRLWSAQDIGYRGSEQTHKNDMLMQGRHLEKEGGLRVYAPHEYDSIFVICKSYVPLKQCYCCKNNAIRRLRPQILLKPPSMIYWNDATVLIVVVPRYQIDEKYEFKNRYSALKFLFFSLYELNQAYLHVNQALPRKRDRTTRVEHAVIKIWQ